MTVSAIIFDCDGVLFDSWPANLAYYNAILAALGLSALSPDWEHRAHVLASSQLFEAMFGADVSLLQRVRAVARNVDYGPFYALMQPAPAMEEVLVVLKRSYRLAMATNRGATVAEIVRRFGLHRFLELAVGVLDVPRPKPSPDMIEKCVVEMGVAPAQTLYVGDAESDLEAALAAGVHFVAVGEHSWSPYRIEQLRDLPAWLENDRPLCRRPTPLPARSE